MSEDIIEMPKIHGEFFEFRKQYCTILYNFLIANDISEIFLNEGYKLGRKAVSDQLSILSVVAIHHDLLIDYLQNLKTEGHLIIADKASVFLEEVLAPFAMVSKEFRESIHLFNKRSVDFALRIHALQEEITHRKSIENDLRKSEERFRNLAEELQASLKEKEALLREIYHRVKNNLQVISSLLNLQMDNIGDEATKKSLLESVTRVKSMALIHEMLYQSESLAKVEMVEYINKLINYLCKIYEVNCLKDNFSFDIEPITLTVDIAIPLGLIANELLTNCFQHAFSNHELGKINISLKRDNDYLNLIISDNGIGISPELNIEKLKSLGMRLIYSLTKQLSGKIELIRDHGTTFNITIKATV